MPLAKLSRIKMKSLVKTKWNQKASCGFPVKKRAARHHEQVTTVTDHVKNPMDLCSLTRTCTTLKSNHQLRLKRLRAARDWARKARFLANQNEMYQMFQRDLQILGISGFKATLRLHKTALCVEYKLFLIPLSFEFVFHFLVILFQQIHPN